MTKVSSRSARRLVPMLAAAALAAGLAAAGPSSATAKLDPAPAKPVHQVGAEFRSPSHNIYCGISSFKGKGYARCDVHHHSYKVPPKPDWCQFDWYGSVQVHRKARFACVSDPATGSRHVPVLAYGHHIKIQQMKCTSRRTGVTCRNLNTHHGFTVSREAAVFF